MSDSTAPPPENGPPADERTDGQLERFEVVLDSPADEAGVASADELAARSAERTARVSALDLDRLPDRDKVRLLVDAEQLERLRAAGLQVSVQRSVPIRPLDPALVATEDDVAGWLTARLGPTPAASEPTAPSDEER